MQSLTVRSENIQRVYGFYINKLLLVNRKYKRKLAWSIEEKSALIDSLIKGCSSYTFRRGSSGGLYCI